MSMHIIKTKDDLALFRRMNYNPDLKFSLEKLTDAQNALWHKRITKDINPCGCETGAAAAIVAVLLSVTCVFIFKVKGLVISNTTWMALLLSVILFAILGKVLGIIYARNRLKKNIDQLTRLLNE